MSIRPVGLVSLCCSMPFGIISGLCLLYKMHYFYLQFESVFKKLSHHLEDMMALYHVGIIVTLADGCVRFKTKQDKFMKVLNF